MENWKRYLAEQSIKAMLVVNNPKNLVMPADRLKGNEMAQALVTLRGAINSAAVSALQGSSIGVTDPEMTSHSLVGQGRRRMDKAKQIGAEIPKRKLRDPAVAIASHPNFEKIQQLPHYQTQAKLTKMEGVWFLSIFVIGQDGADLVSKQIRNPEIAGLIESIPQELEPMFKQLPGRLTV
jgi:hypothetical protein